MGSALILRLDTAGQPLEWLTWQDAVYYYALDRVAWTAGEHTLTIYGGTSRLTGLQSQMQINSIIAVRGSHRQFFHQCRVSPTLTNRELFRRDMHICMYCGDEFQEKNLTRDHIIPRSRGGRDTWTNVVTACRSCNVHKGCRTPEEAHMPLIAVPYAPNRAEYLALLNHNRILADQMAFLKSRFGKSSRWA